MEVSFETLEGLNRKLKIALPETTVASEIDARVRSVAKTAHVDGFRPGKAPERLIRMKYGKAINEEVMNKIVSESVQKALEEKKEWKLASRPQLVQEPALLAGQPLEIEIAFQVMPEFDLLDLSAVTIERPIVEVTEADVDAALEKLREEYKGYETVSRPAKDQDEIEIDFEGKLGEALLENGSAESFKLVLGSKSMIEGFEAGLLGKVAGDVFDLSLHFPEAYFKEELAGKPVTFHITVKAVREPQMPVLDDAFAEKLGIKDGGMNKLKADVRDNLVLESERIVKNIIRDALSEKLLALYSFEVPSDLVAQEQVQLQRGRIEQLQQLLKQGRNFSDLLNSDSSPEYFEKEAHRRVKSGILFSRYLEHFDVKAEPEKVRAAIERMAKGFQQPEQVINWYYGDEKRLAEIESLVLEETIIEKLLATCHVVDEIKAYQTLIAEEEAKAAQEGVHRAHHHDEHDHHHHDGQCCDHDHEQDK